jgi:hypothetical protein
MMTIDDTRLIALIEHARRGDLHGMLGIPENVDIRAALAATPGDCTDYNRLLALYVASDVFDSDGGEDVDGIIYDYGEHTFFRHDDDGYVIQQFNVDLARIAALPKFGVVDGDRAVRYVEGALEGPSPEGALERVAVWVDQAAPEIRERLLVILQAHLQSAAPV